MEKINHIQIAKNKRSGISNNYFSFFYGKDLGLFKGVSRLLPYFILLEDEPAVTSVNPEKTWFVVVIGV